MKSQLFLGIAASATVVAAPNAVASDSIGKLSQTSFEKQIESSVEGTRGGARTISRGRTGGFRGSRSGSFNRGGFKGNRNIRSGNRNIRGGSRNFRGGNSGFGGGFIGFYQRPSYGFVLPSYWLASSFGISNYSSFGLSQPSYGYNWSRYYDDAVLRNEGGTVVDYRQNIDWSQGGGAFAPNGYYNQTQNHQTQPEFNPSIQADRSVYQSGQHVYASGSSNVGSANFTTPGGSYNGQWSDVRTDENGIVHGVWRGEVSDQNGQKYLATYQGTFTRDGQFQPTGAPVTTAVAPAPLPAPAPQYQTPAGFERYESCLKSRGVKGGAIGAAVGAVAGNRIAGRGSRLEGSLIGGGVGALAGLGIEKALDKCERFLPVPQQGTIAAAPAPIAQQPIFHQQAPIAQAPAYGHQQARYTSAVPQQAPVNRTPAGYGSYERCLKGRGVKGGTLGAVIGAVAGNRIAGRGNRLEGSLIGGGVGALAGLGIEKALDKCERFLPAPQQHARVAQHRGYASYPQQVGYYWIPGGYYYPPAQTTVTVIPGTVTTTVTEEYVESYAPTKRLVKPVKRLRKPGY